MIQIGFLGNTSVTSSYRTSSANSDETSTRYGTRQFVPLKGVVRDAFSVTRTFRPWVAAPIRRAVAAFAPCKGEAEMKIGDTIKQDGQAYRCVDYAPYV